MLRQELKQKMVQRLTPQQIQVIKLLELPLLQLEQKIKKELEENPVLEEGTEDTAEVLKTKEDNTEDISPAAETEDSGTDDSSDSHDEYNRDDEEFSVEDFIQDEDIPYYKLDANNYDPDSKREEIPITSGLSFHEFLQSQLGEREITPRQYDIGLYLIGNLDGDGYLRRDLQAIADDMAFNENMDVSLQELQDMLGIIQDCDPAGIGARDIRECLLLQIKRKNQDNEQWQLARQIIENYFEEFTKKHYDKIMHHTGMSEKKVKAAIDEILTLNPKPGGTFHDALNKSIEHVTPDFILENRDGQLFLSLNNRNMPELRINSLYADMLNGSHAKPGKQEREAMSFIKQKIATARNFIDALKQRQITLLTAMNAIIEYQKDYFLDGDERKIKPMILKDIAEKTGFDISTISRVANSKYIQTQFGVFPLKFFFSEGMQTLSGEAVSTHKIKKILKECIEKENKKKPLTDDKLAAILKEKGYNLARRTVAKYREQMELPVARLRKELK